MESPPPTGSSNSNSTIRSDLLIRAKSGSFTETLTDAFTSLWSRPKPLQSPSPSSSAFRPTHDLSQIISDITLKDIQEAKHCGGGGFGTVRIFEHPTGGKVALKQLRVSGGQQGKDLRRRTMREGETWQKLKHPWVLPFLGVLETPNDLYLVSSHVKNGALDGYLRENPKVDRQKMLWKTALAIAYLHEQGIVHGDIKAANILVSDRVEPLLCDFGLSKPDDGVTSMGLQGVGTVPYQSPEILTDGGGKSFASDVWAFGMTIFEVLSGKTPFYQYTAPTAIIGAVVIRDERPPMRPSRSPSGRSYDPIWSAAQGCWEKDPAIRATIQDTARRLRPHGVAIRGHASEVSCVAVSPDGLTILSGSEDCTLRLWDAASGSQRGEPLEGHTNWVSCLAISPDGKTIVSGSRDCTLRLWDMPSGNRRGMPLKGHAERITCLAISPDGTTIVSGSWDRTLRLWDLASGTQRGETLEGYSDWISCVAITPDNATIVSGSGYFDRTLRLWDIASGRQRGEPLQGHTEGISCLAISPDGTTIVSGSRDRSIRIWDFASGSQRGESLEGHTNWINCLAISPDGTTVVSGSRDRTLRVWDVATGTQRGEPLKGHHDGINCVAITPDGTTIVSGSEDCTIRLWNMPPKTQETESVEGGTP